MPLPCGNDDMKKRKRPTKMFSPGSKVLRKLFVRTLSFQVIGGILVCCIQLCMLACLEVHCIKNLIMLQRLIQNEWMKLYTQ